MNGQLRYFAFHPINSSCVQQNDIYTEVGMEHLPLRADVGIMPTTPNKNFKSLDWPFKGILLEFDGPHHYYAPCYNNKYESTLFTRNRVDLIKNLEGYKVFTIPFYITECPHEAHIFDTIGEE